MSDCIDHGHKAPRYSVGSLNGVKAGLHRIAYCKHHGVPLEDLKGLVVRHTCNNMRCINPHHLILGTFKDNSEDMVRAGRQTKGTDHWNAKLTPELVEEIRKSTLSGPKAAALYGVSHHTIYRIRKGKLWKHLKINS